jgi:hypothetical protein
MQHFLLALAMLLLMGIAAKERTAVKEPADNQLMQNEKVHEKEAVYELSDEDIDAYSGEFNVSGCYTDFFQ